MNLESTPATVPLNSRDLQREMDDDVVVVKVGSSNDAIASQWVGSVRDPVDASENLLRITDSTITSITASDSEIFMLSELQNNITLNTISHEDSTQFGPATVCLPPIDKGRDGESPSQRVSSVDGVVTVSPADAHVIFYEGFNATYQ